MRILLDTNIFIPMEDSSSYLDKKLATLHRLSQLNLELLIHPESKNDIARDKNESRKQAMLSRLPKYMVLTSPVNLDDEEETCLFGKPKKDNDKVDNRILYAVYKDCVHLLVTEDSGIHKKARKLGLGERVLTVEQIVASLKYLENRENSPHPNIKNVHCYTLNLQDPLFASLRNGYEKFDQWFKEKCCKTARMAWVSFNEADCLNAICIYKIEEDPIVTNDCRALRGIVVKLCTFKVTKTGVKFGELLLKQSFTYAVDNNINYVYLTIEPGKHGELRSLVSNYGFTLYGVDEKGRDDVFIKEFPKSPPSEILHPLEFAIKYFPMVQISSNNAYIVPIKPEYHRVLFPEAQCQQSLFADQGNSAGNSILQAYLSKSPIKSIRPGDVLFFYRSDDHKEITSYGIVEQFIIESEPEKILQWVAKRTVYTYSEIKSMAGCHVKIILFRVVRHLKSPLGFEKLKEDKVINGSIQSVTKLSVENLWKLIDIVGSDGSFVSN
ncbi:MAG: hypothetical protein OFPII_39090 [Osedax symbiont Rs1]|nr:MAG: hypothetical protein OFPII_39090 [Osedax symbiont Rs1]